MNQCSQKNQSLADYGEDEGGRNYIFLTDGTWINFQFIKRLDWIKFQQFVNSTPQQREEYFRFAPSPKDLYNIYITNLN